jgi:hypothetical protein
MTLKRGSSAPGGGQELLDLDGAFTNPPPGPVKIVHRQAVGEIGFRFLLGELEVLVVLLELAVPDFVGVFNEAVEVGAEFTSNELAELADVIVIRERGDVEPDVLGGAVA